MPVTIRKLYSQDDAWDLEEAFCPKCNSSIMNITGWQSECWNCKAKMPRMFKHFLHKKMARYVYHTKVSEKT